MCNTLDGILDGMSKVIHRVNAPFISGIVMGHMSHTIDNRITHIHVWRSHINLCAEYFLSIRIFSGFHILEQLQVLFHASVTVRAVLSRLGQSSAVLADLLCSQVTHISFSFFDQLYSCLIHLIKIVGRKEQTIFPVSPQPLDIFLDRIYELHLLFGRIIKTHVELTIVLLSQSIVQQDGFCMSNMQVAIRLRRKTGMHCVIHTFRKIFFYLNFNKILRYHFILHNRILLG